MLGRHPSLLLSSSYTFLLFTDTINAKQYIPHSQIRCGSNDVTTLISNLSNLTRVVSNNVSVFDQVGNAGGADSYVIVSCVVLFLFSG